MLSSWIGPRAPSEPLSRNRDFGRRQRFTVDGGKEIALAGNWRPWGRSVTSPDHQRRIDQH
jgi:hypothetical protein